MIIVRIISLYLRGVGLSILSDILRLRVAITKLQTEYYAYRLSKLKEEVRMLNSKTKSELSFRAVGYSEKV